MARKLMPNANEVASFSRLRKDRCLTTFSAERGVKFHAHFIVKLKNFSCYRIGTTNFSKHLYLTHVL